MTNNLLYPVLSLNSNITEYLRKIVSSDILGCLESGLSNSIDLIDIGSHMTDIAYISRNSLTGFSEVKLSAAFCQYFWFITDVALKLLDYNTVVETCKSSNITIEDFKAQTEFIKKMPIELLQLKLSACEDIDIHKYLSYVETVSELLDPSFEQQIIEEYKLALSIINNDEIIDIESINRYDLNSKYHQRVNSVYCYGIAFILLHELSHHSLGHLERPDNEGDEENADMSAFWSIFNDITGEERFTANVSILFVFFSFMQIDPSLKEDGIHPRDDKRMFAIYDFIKSENHKYTVLLIRLLDLWAYINNKSDYPFGLSCKEDSIEKIKLYFESHSNL